MNPDNQHLRAIIMMMAAFAVFTLLDATAKYLVGFLGVGQVVFARYAFAVAFVFMAMARPGGRAFFVQSTGFYKVCAGYCC